MEVDEIEVEDVRPDLEFDARHTWNPRERVIIRAVGDYLAKVSAVILGEVV